MGWLDVMHKLCAKIVAKREQENISEPVISFLEVFKKTPKRFKIKYTRGITPFSPDFEFIDTITNESWSFYKRRYIRIDVPLRFQYALPHPFLTQEEKSLIITTIHKYYEDRKDRLRKLVNKKERERLTNIYQEG